MKPISVNIDNSIIKYFKEAAETMLTDFNIKYNNRGKHTNATLHSLSAIELVEPSSYVALGALIADVKKVAEEKLVESVRNDKTSKAVIIPLRIENEVAKIIDKEYRDIFNIVSRTVGNDFSLLGFDLTNIKGRKEVFERAFAIGSAINGVRNNVQNEIELKHIKGQCRKLEKHCSYIQQDKTSYVRMTGKELIEKGYASIFATDGSAGVVNKIVNKFADSSKEYLYFNTVIQLENQYVVLLKKPIEHDPIPVDFQKEIVLRYDYGEQMFMGHGVELVDSFCNMIIDRHNKQIEGSKK